MKSLRESLLDRNAKLDAGGVIKSELVGNNRDWNNVDFRMDENGVLHIDSTSWLLPRFKVEDMKLMKTLGVKSLQFHEGVRQINIPVQRFVTNIQMDHPESFAYVANVKNASKMTGWTIQAFTIELTSTGRMVLEDNTFSFNGNSHISSVVIREARGWNWRNNRITGISRLNVFFKSGPDDFYQWEADGPDSFMGEAANIPDLNAIALYPNDYYYVAWERIKGKWEKRYSMS